MRKWIYGMYGMGWYTENNSIRETYGRVTCYSDDFVEASINQLVNKDQSKFGHSEFIKMFTSKIEAESWIETNIDNYPSRVWNEQERSQCRIIPLVTRLD